MAFVGAPHPKIQKLLATLGLAGREVKSLTVTIPADDAVMVTAEIYASAETLDAAAAMVDDVAPMIVEVPREHG